VLDTFVFDANDRLRIPAAEGDLPVCYSALLVVGFVGLLSFALSCHTVTAQTLQVPDTLDLAVRADAAMNGLAGTVDEEHHYEFLFRFDFNPPDMSHDAFSFAACGPKYLESFVMMDLMTPADDSEEQRAAQGAWDYILSCLDEEDGLFYSKIGPDRPWDVSSPEDWANVYGQARMLRALLAMSEVDADPIWQQRMDKLVATLKRIAIYKDDYAYFPTTPNYGDIFSYPKSGWKNTLEPMEIDPKEAGEHIADVPNHHFGIPLYIGGLVEPLVRYAQRTGDVETLQFAGKLVRFLRKPEACWQPTAVPSGHTGAAQAWYSGHFHAHTLCLRSLINYAAATHDAELKEFVRDGYEFSRQFGIARLGWFQEYTGKPSHETCGLSNMIAIALMLTREGVGDYWEDVDCYVRNHLAEAQYLDLGPVSHNLSAEQQQLLERGRGTFAGWGDPTALAERVMNCCTANGSQALYFVWDSVAQFDERAKQANVNLLLNYRSPVLRLDSYLPYEGKVIIQNHKAERLNVRIPAWAELSAVRVMINGEAAAARFVARYLQIDSAPGDEVVVTFPMVESTERYQAIEGGETYTIRFKGNTAVDIEPRNNGAKFPTYQRQYYLGHEAPLRSVPDFTTDQHVHWYR
jgi:hypothetical protein